jgi:DNA-binding protein WhiA
LGAVTLSEDLRNELAAVAPMRDCDRLAELSGLFHAAGSIHLRGRGAVSMHLDVATSAVARRAFTLLRAFGVESEIRTYRQPAFERATRFQLHVRGTDATLRLLHEAGVLDQQHRPLERPPKRVVARSCCRGAYLRGALLGGGSLSGPRDPHLEIRTAEHEGAEFVAAVAEQLGAALCVVDRGRFSVAYAKGAETIVDVLGAAGAADAVLVLEEHSVLAATRSGANRLANADHANIVRASRAAHAQIQAVRRLEADGTLANLPEPLVEAARLRVKYPMLSLRELAQRCDPPTTKASAYRRLRKLQEIADS